MDGWEGGMNEWMGERPEWREKWMNGWIWMDERERERESERERANLRSSSSSSSSW